MQATLGEEQAAHEQELRRMRQGTNRYLLQTFPSFSATGRRGELVARRADGDNQPEKRNPEEQAEREEDNEEGGQWEDGWKGWWDKNYKKDNEDDEDDGTCYC